MDARNKIKIPYSRMEIILNLLSALGVIAIIGYLYINWNGFPESIPSHFDFSGLPDQWSNLNSIILLPVISTGIYLLFYILIRTVPKFNYVDSNSDLKTKQNILSRQMLFWMNAEIVWLFNYIIYMSIQVGLGQAQGIGSLSLPIILTIIFGTTGWHIYKINRAKNTLSNC